MHGSRSKIPSKKSRPYIYYVKFLVLLGAPYIYDINRLRVKDSVSVAKLREGKMKCRHKHGNVFGKQQNF
jgi:hypothetical protein